MWRCYAVIIERDRWNNSENCSRKKKQLQTSYFVTIWYPYTTNKHACLITTVVKTHTHLPTYLRPSRAKFVGLRNIIIIITRLPVSRYRGSRSKNKNNHNNKTTSAYTFDATPNMFYPRKRSRWKSHSAAAAFLFVKIRVVDRAESARDGPPRRSCENTIISPYAWFAITYDIIIIKRVANVHNGPPSGSRIPLVW